MAKPMINNIGDLMEEKKRLKARLQSDKASIRRSFEELKDEVNPFSGLKKTAHDALSAGTANPLIKFGVKRASEFLIGKVLLKRAGWLPRLVVPFLVREATTRLIGSKADKKIAGALHSLATRLRDEKKSEK